MISPSQFERKIRDVRVNPLVWEFRRRAVEISSICLIDGEFANMSSFFVHFEEARAGFVFETHSQFSRDIVRVMNAIVSAESIRGRDNVSRVARKEDTSFTVPGKYS